MDTRLRITSKSFYYNLISHNYHVYLSNEFNQFLVAKLICTDCRSKWETSRQECFLCGTENYHVYTCIECDHKVSITAANKTTCPNCQEHGTLKQMCINPDCITNTSTELRKKVISSGGVFQGNGGFSIRQMSCKQCGSSKNEYVSFECVIVPSIDELNTPNSIFIEREADDKPAKHYWIKSNDRLIKFNIIEDLIEYLLHETESNKQAY